MPISTRVVPAAAAANQRHGVVAGELVAADGFAHVDGVVAQALQHGGAGHDLLGGLCFAVGAPGGQVDAEFHCEGFLGNASMLWRLILAGFLSQ